MISPDKAHFPPHGGCPSDEEIGAFLDGVLGPDDRARLLDHFASCEDCYEIVQGAGRLLFEVGQPEGGGAIVPLRRDQGRRRILLLAAAATLTLTLGFLVYRSLRPELTAAELFSATADTEDQEELSQRAWRGEIFRKAGDDPEAPQVNQSERSFRLGALTVNLYGALKTGNPDLSRDTVRQMRPLLRQTIGAGEVLQSYEGIEDKLTSPSLDSLLVAASEAEEALGRKLDLLLFDLGKWAAAGRLAALDQDPHFFRDRANLRFLRWLSTHEEALKREAFSEVLLIQEVLEKPSLAKADYEKLQESFKRILEIYFPGPDPLEPF